MARSPTSSLAGLILFAGRIACVIVLAWFVVFAVDQTSNASAHQQNEVLSGPSAPSPASGTPSRHESSLKRTLNHTAEALTSPFSGAVSGHSEWTTHIVETLIALLVYGVGIGFLVRFVRMHG
jgi:predicted PurR-regulated permease PerM